MYYKYPQIELTFNPETLGDSDNWQNLINSIKNKKNYHIKSCGTNSHYCVSHEDGSLVTNVGAYGLGMVGSLNKRNKKLLRKIKMIAEYVENNVEYIDVN